MQSASSHASFPSLNRGYNALFRPHHLSIGLVVPIVSYPHSPIPDMTAQVENIRTAEELGFAAVWLRDVPFNVPSFGDVGQIYDPFVYLGLLAGQTSRITLGVGSLILPLRHPAHVAKAAASVDVLSKGRLVLGVASGDRPEEYPALRIPFHERGERFRASFEYISTLSEDTPSFQSIYGDVRSIDMLPKPTASKIPLLITGGSQQEPDWIARNGDGWMIYPRDVRTQRQVVRAWRERLDAAKQRPKPVMQPLYIDLVDDPDASPQPIHLGFRTGIRFLRSHLRTLEEIGVHHVALNLRFNRADINTTLNNLAEHLLPHFPTQLS